MKVDYSGMVGDQRPRLSHLPIRIGSHGTAGIQLAEMAGLRLDDWQAWLLCELLGHKADGETYWNEVLERRMPKSSAYEAAIIVARQNGKGALLEALELAWLFLLGMGGTHANPSSVLHSAHEMGTSKEHFGRIEGLISGCPELKAELGPGGIRYSNGDERIQLNTGQRLIFKTRTKSAARGFSIDKLVIDEAMYLTDEHVKALEPATEARPDPQIIYTGSVGNRESVHFGRARQRGIAGNDPRLLLAEWSADLCTEFCDRDPLGKHICPVHDDRADPLTWFKANPGLGIRLQLENVNSKFGSWSADVFNQERLTFGDWPADGEQWAVITQEGWLNCVQADSAPRGHITFAIYVSQDLKWSAIVAAGANADGNIHIEVTGRDGRRDYRPGFGWVVQRAAEIRERAGRNRCTWVVNKDMQAGQLWDQLAKAGFNLITPTAREYAQSCADFFASVMPIGGSKPDLRHTGQPELMKAVANAEKRDFEELWRWDSRNATDDVSCLMAATSAVWGHRQRVNKPKPKPSFAWV